MPVNEGHTLPFSGVYKQSKKDIFSQTFLASLVISNVLHMGRHFFFDLYLLSGNINKQTWGGVLLFKISHLLK